jgi:hypothetical protein
LVPLRERGKEKEREKQFETYHSPSSQRREKERENFQVDNQLYG